MSIRVPMRSLYLPGPMTMYFFTDHFWRTIPRCVADFTLGYGILCTSALVSFNRQDITNWQGDAKDNSVRAAPSRETLILPLRLSCGQCRRIAVLTGCPLTKTFLVRVDDLLRSLWLPWLSRWPLSPWIAGCFWHERPWRISVFEANLTRVEGTHGQSKTGSRG